MTDPIERRLRCHECGKRRPESETFLVYAMVGGSYRRAAQRTQIRVCRSCTEAHVKYVLGERGRATAINTGRIRWERAVRYFGIKLPKGTLLDRMTGRVEE